MELIQQRLDAERSLAGLEESTDRESLERDFIEVAKAYSERRGITYTACVKRGCLPRCCEKQG